MIVPSHFEQIIGEQLSAVTFVMDYLQLQFNPPPTINAYAPVTVASGGGICVSGDDQFRNRLSEQITKTVKRVAIRDEVALDIEFEDGSVISVSLRTTDCVGHEALEFVGRDNVRMVI